VECRHPVYTLVFATDSSPGDAIMGHLYGSAATSTIPEMQTRAQIARQHRREDETGLERLPGMDEYEIEAAKGTPRSYQHEPPWEPTPAADEVLDLEGEADTDPDDIEWDEDADETDEDSPS